MAQFTPRPWTPETSVYLANSLAKEILGDDGWVFAAVWTHNGKKARPTANADINLICAAPDFYAACKSAYKSGDDPDQNHLDGLLTLLAAYANEHDWKGDNDADATRELLQECQQLYRRLLAACVKAESKELNNV